MNGEVSERSTDHGRDEKRIKIYSIRRRAGAGDAPRYDRIAPLTRKYTRSLSDIRSGTPHSFAGSLCDIPDSTSTCPPIVMIDASLLS